VSSSVIATEGDQENNGTNELKFSSRYIAMFFGLMLCILLMYAIQHSVIHGEIPQLIRAEILFVSHCDAKADCGKNFCST
jgi:hypothetical protein